MPNDPWDKYKYDGIELGTFTGDYSENSNWSETSNSNHNPARSFFKDMPIISTEEEAHFSTKPDGFSTNNSQGWQANKYLKN